MAPVIQHAGHVLIARNLMTHFPLALYTSLYPSDGFKKWYKTEELVQKVYSSGCMCVPKLGTVLAMHFGEVVIMPFIASAVARRGIGDGRPLVPTRARVIMVMIIERSS